LRAVILCSAALIDSLETAKKVVERSISEKSESESMHNRLRSRLFRNSLKHRKPHENADAASKAKNKTSILTGARGPATSASVWGCREIDGVFRIAPEPCSAGPNDATAAREPKSADSDLGDT
jgi:hypothetical protein